MRFSMKRFIVNRLAHEELQFYFFNGISQHIITMYVGCEKKLSEKHSVR